MKTLVLANQKGGVGKSAVATLLAQYLAREGRRVLAIDLDHQGNFSSAITRSERATLSPTTAVELMTAPAARIPEGKFVLAPAADGLLLLDPQGQMHNTFARNFRAFLRSVDGQFDVCVIDTHPNPDIRAISAMVSADFVLSPIQLNQEAIDGVRALLHHPRLGFHKIKTLLNPKLTLIGLLPTLVEATPFQKANYIGVIERHLSLMIRLSPRDGDLACLPKRSAIAEAQAQGALLWEMKKTAARDAWAEIERPVRHIAGILTGEVPHGQP